MYNISLRYSYSKLIFWGAHNLINAYDGQQSTHFSWWTMININAWWTMINNKVGK